MAKKIEYPINYQGYEVMYSHNDECPNEYKEKGVKYNPVFDDLGSFSAAMQKLDSVRKSLKNTKWCRQHFEYSSYILKINPHKFELHFKCYIIL